LKVSRSDPTFVVGNILNSTDGHKPTNGTSKEGHGGKPSCWFWSDNEDYPNDKATDDGQTYQAGDSFKGKNKEGESKKDPEKGLKDSRGGPGLNVLDVDKSNKPAAKDIPQVSFF
jgi:hypothetical protein